MAAIRQWRRHIWKRGPIHAGSSIDRSRRCRLNNDGQPDVVFTNSALGTVTVLFAMVMAVFRPSRLPSRSQSRLGRRRRFQDGDGIPDLVVTNTASNQVSVLLVNKSLVTALLGYLSAAAAHTNVLTSYSGDGSRLPSQSSTVSLASGTLPTQTINFAP